VTGTIDLGLIEKLDSWYPFCRLEKTDDSDDEIDDLDYKILDSDQALISDISKKQSDKPAIFDAIKYEIKKLFDMCTIIFMLFSISHNTSPFTSFFSFVC
jgi:hypothetical protein